MHYVEPTWWRNKLQVVGPVQTAFPVMLNSDVCFTANSLTYHTLHKALYLPLSDMMTTLEVEL